MSSPVGHADDKTSGFEIVFLCIRIKSGLYISDCHARELAPVLYTPRLTSHACIATLGCKLAVCFYALAYYELLKSLTLQSLNVPPFFSFLFIIIFFL